MLRTRTRWSTRTLLKFTHVNGLTREEVWQSAGSGAQWISLRVMIIDGWLRCRTLTAQLPGLYPLPAQPLHVWNSQLLWRQLKAIGSWANGYRGTHGVACKRITAAAHSQARPALHTRRGALPQHPHSVLTKSLWSMIQSRNTGTNLQS